MSVLEGVTEGNAWLSCTSYRNFTLHIVTSLCTRLGAVADLEKKNRTAPEGDRPPKLRKNLPAVCQPSSLGLHKYSSSPHIVSRLLLPVVTRRASRSHCQVLPHVDSAMVSAALCAERAEAAKKKATKTAERNAMLAKAGIAAKRKGIAAAVKAVRGLLEAVPSAERRLRDLRTGKTPPRPAPRSTTILDPELRKVGLHLLCAQRKLTVGAAELRTTYLPIFRWLAGRAQERGYTLHLGQQLKFSCNAKEQPRLAVALLQAVTQLKVAGYFKYLKFVCLHGLAAVAAATDAPAYDDVLDALDALLRTCHAQCEWILGVNFGELALGPLMQARVVEVLSAREVPLFYFSANYSFKEKLKVELRGARQHREAAAKKNGACPWWVDVANRDWLKNTGETRQPPSGHGCEQGFRRKCSSGLGEYFWQV